MLYVLLRGERSGARAPPRKAAPLRRQRQGRGRMGHRGGVRQEETSQASRSDVEPCTNNIFLSESTDLSGPADDACQRGPRAAALHRPIQHGPHEGKQTAL